MATVRKTKATPAAAVPQSRTPASPTPTRASAGVSHDDIAKRAYEIWQASGSLHGRHQDHWLQAERELRTSAS